MAATLIVLASTVLGARRALAGQLDDTVALDVVVLALAQVLPGLVLCCAGWRAASRRSRYVELAQHLAGWGPWTRLVVVAADALVLAVGAALTITVGVVVGTTRLSAALTAPVISAVLGCTVATVALSACSAAISRVTDGLGVFLLISTGITGIGSVLYWTGSAFPVLQAGAELWPTQAAAALFTHVSAQAYRRGVAALAVMVMLAVCVLVRSRHDSQPRVPLRSGGRAILKVGHGFGLGRVTGRLAACHIAAVALGLVVPASVSPWVPWSLRPAWQTAVRDHRASYDVAREWLTAYQQGDRAKVAQLSNRSESTLVGPFRSQLQGLLPRTAAVDTSRDGSPNVVSVDDGSSAGELSGRRLYVCMVDIHGIWRVDAIRSQPDCDALSGQAS